MLRPIVDQPLGHVAELQLHIINREATSPCDSVADPLCRRPHFLVRDMGVAQRHGQLSVAEQLRYDGQRDALENGLTGMGVPQTHILEPGHLSDPVPEVQFPRQRPGRIAGDGKT